MREYKIIHYAKDNERVIIKKKDDEIWYLSPEKVWTRKPERAKRYFHKDEAVGILVTIKMQGNLKTEEEYIDEKINEGKEKRTRKEL